ncbi:MAG: RHS repeat-associated core domain-containing protein, partial [Flavobacteriaceae bacterium]|nr:RHS repeat-associated core domain-containing protein [Flavobacteriaceae bacterium]
NVRGWLTDINDVEYQAGGGLGGPQLNAYNDLFHFRINYNNVEGTGSAIPLYNGNIAQTFWKSDQTDKQLRGYSYVYDPLNRFLEAKGQKGNSLGSMSAYNAHDVDNISYDLNGNLLTLDRMGTNVNHDPAGDWDLLSYTYEGNRLTNVADASQHAFADFGFKDGNDVNASLNNDYDYDDNGNLVKDLNKHVQTTTYNHLDLPTYVNMDDQQGTAGTLSYVYDALGTKLEKTFTDGGINPTTVVTQYAAGYVYQKYGTDPNDLQFFPHPEGYVEPTSTSSGGNEKSIEKFNQQTGQTTQTGFRYVYQYKDHLGNVRLSYVDSDGNGSIDPNGEIIEESHYYPFGLKQNGYNNNISSDANLVAQQWKYADKELNSELGLGLYDFGARNYDPTLGRWMNIDPLAESTPSWNPYNYVQNTPIQAIDPDGLSCVGCGNNVDSKIGKIDYGYSGNGSLIFNETGQCHCLGNGGGPGDPPAVNEGSPIVLEEVYLTNARSSYSGTTYYDTWTTESQTFGDNITFAEWHENNPQFSSDPSLAFDQWYVSYGGEHYDWHIASVKKAEAEALARHLLNFGFYLSSSWGMGGSYNLSAKPIPTRSFGLKVNTTNISTTQRLQNYTTRAAKEIDAMGDAAFTPKQLRAIQKNPKLRPMFRGNRIDVRARALMRNDYYLRHLQSNYTRGPDFIHPRTGKWWDMTTQGAWQSHVDKYGSGGTLLNTHY